MNLLTLTTNGLMGLMSVLGLLPSYTSAVPLILSDSVRMDAVHHAKVGYNAKDDQVDLGHLQRVVCYVGVDEMAAHAPNWTIGT